MPTAIAACLAFAVSFGPAAHADVSISVPTSTDTSQVGSLSNNYNTDSAGSDTSLRSSSVYIMQALMDANNAQYLSMVKNGYQAYGKYRNAENLDRLKDASAMMANNMGSVGNGPMYAQTYTNTTFDRLDPSFLHQGSYDKIAAEFERETGMKREDFLSQIGNISDMKIKRSDPMMIDKAFSNFESFIAKIPNAEFRKNVEKNIAIFPSSARRGVIASAVTKLAGFFAVSGPAGTAPGASSITDLAKGQFAEGKGAAEAGKSAADLAREPAGSGGADASSTVTTQQGTGSNGKTGAEGAVAAALFAQQGTESGEATIFQQVSKRYRILSPQFQLAKPAN